MQCGRCVRERGGAVSSRVFLPLLLLVYICIYYFSALFASSSFQDPFPKPCYLFALVAGALECQVDTFQTASGRDVTLKIYAQKHNIDKVGGERETATKQ